MRPRLSALELRVLGWQLAFALGTAFLVAPLVPRLLLLAGPLQAAITATTVLFFGWFWTRSGQTLGMQAWRLRVQQPDGSAIGWRQALIRMGGAVLSGLCLGAGYWWALFDRDRCTWHDRLSGTRVVLLPKRD